MPLWNAADVEAAADRQTSVPVVEAIDAQATLVVWIDGSVECSVNGLRLVPTPLPVLRWLWHRVTIEELRDRAPLRVLVPFKVLTDGKEN